MRTNIDAFIQRRFEWIVDRPWTTIFLVLLSVAALAAGMKNLTVTNDYRYFFSDENPNLAAFEDITDTYASPDSILIVIKPNDGYMTDPKWLKVLGELTEAAWKIPYTSRVDSLTNYQHIEADEDSLNVSTLVEDPQNVSQDDATRIRDIALNDSPLVDLLISPDGKTSGVFANVQVPMGDQDAINEVVSYSRALRDEFRAKYPDMRLELSGTTIMAAGFSEVAARDLGALTPVMFIVIGLVVLVLLRSMAGMFASLLVIALAAIAAIGLAGWFGIVMSAPSGTAPTIILTIAIADSIHILVTMLVYLHQGMPKREAILESLRLNLEPIFLTSVTTAIGFFCLNFSDSPPFWDLGNIAGMGCLAALLFSLTILPALIMVLPIKGNAALKRQTDYMKRIAEFVIAHPKQILITTGAIAIAAMSLVPRISLDDRLVEYLGPTTEFRQAADFTTENLTSYYQLQYSLPAAEPGAITDPDYLKTLEEFRDWWLAQPEVIHVASFSEIIRRLNKAMNAGDPAFDTIPDSRPLAAQYLLLYEMSLPFGLDLNSQIDVDRSATKYSVVVKSLSTDEVSALIDRADIWLKENAPAHMYALPAGHTLMFAFIGENNMTGMTQGTLLAIVLIAFCLMAALRSIRLGLLSFVPNLTPPLVAFGLYSLFSETVGFWASFVTATALGLIVDATVHFLSKYQRARIEQKASAEDAVRYAFQTVGTALLVSTLVIMIGFSILATSQFKIIGMMGMMVALTVFIAFVLDFLLLPALLLWIDRPSKKTTQSSSLADQKPAEIMETN